LQPDRQNTPARVEGPLRPITRSDAAGWFDWFAVPFGLFFVAMGVYAHLIAGIPFWIGSGCSILFGAAVALGGYAGLTLRRKFGLSRASVTPEAVAPGDSFTFRYARQVRGGTMPVLAASFVLRETIVTQRGAKTIHRDHLVRHYPGERLDPDAAGEVVKELPFEVPAAGHRAFEVQKGRPLSWLIKVRLSPEQHQELWDEYELILTPALPATAPSRDAYDVILLGAKPLSSVKVTGVMAKLLPHLDSGQVSDLFFGTHAPLLEGVSQEEAELARGKLMEAGARVEVRCGGRVVEPHTLPIPDSTPVAASDTLPVVADGPAPDPLDLPRPSKR
jgi:hypothetical protein